MTGNVHFGRRFGKWEIRGAQTYLGVLAEHFLGEEQQHLLQVGEGDVLVNIESFNLMEETVGAGGDGLVSVNPSWADNADRRLLMFHYACLDRTCVAA